MTEHAQGGRIEGTVQHDAIPVHVGTDCCYLQFVPNEHPALLKAINDAIGLI